MVDMINIMHWDYDGLRADNYKAKSVMSSYRDVTTITTVFSGLFYLIVIFLDNLEVINISNIYVIVIMYLLLSVAQLFNQLSTSNARKETLKLIEKYSGKIK